MADIEYLDDPLVYQKILRVMPNGQLQGQMQVQQGAIHAVRFLLANGCSVETATEMLEALQLQEQTLRDEIARRGLEQLFETDQTHQIH